MYEHYKKIAFSRPGRDPHLRNMNSNSNCCSLDAKKNPNSDTKTWRKWFSVFYGPANAVAPYVTKNQIGTCIIYLRTYRQDKMRICISKYDADEFVILADYI